MKHSSDFGSLAGLAANPLETRGRFYDEERGEIRGPRDAFQRDRDRIIHSVSFRRLRGKTQVFVAPDGDHFRVRLTHSLEVAQIGRAIARALGLNEDLTEALCLAHDIGHPPFGHAGENALKHALADHGSFDHNAHALRMLVRLERPYPRFRGLNLTWEMLEGLAKHNGPVESANWALADIDSEFPLDLQSWPSLEAQVAALADDIAYDNHDIDDGLRAGLFTLEQLLAEVPIAREAWSHVEQRYGDATQKAKIAELIREQIGLMVNDLLGTTLHGVREAGVRSIADVRAYAQALVSFSDGVAKAERELKRFLYAHMYEHEKNVEIAATGEHVVQRLFEAYSDDPSFMTAAWYDELPQENPARARHIADFIAGMTDRYAFDQYEKVIGPLDFPVRF